MEPVVVLPEAFCFHIYLLDIHEQVHIENIFLQVQLNRSVYPFWLGLPGWHILYLDENGDRITISPGYKDAKAIKKELTFVGEEHYKSKSYDDFSKAYGK